MKKLKLFVISLISLPMLFPVIATAQVNPLDPACSQVNESNNSEICGPLQSGEDLISGDRSIFLIVADVLTIAAGIIAVVMIIISGISMITSSGDPAKIKKSRDTIIYSVVGVFLVLLSRSIVIFIVGRL